MATDICDKELKELRNARWEKAFKGVDAKESEHDTQNRKATIVIEVNPCNNDEFSQHWINACLFFLRI